MEDKDDNEARNYGLTVKTVVKTFAIIFVFAIYLIIFLKIMVLS